MPHLEALEGRVLFSAISPAAAARGALPRVTVADAAVVEGTGGSTVLRFVFTRNGTAAQLNRASSVTYETRDVAGDDGAAAGDDFTAKTGVVRFQPGQRTKSVRVVVNPDGVFEGGAGTTETMRLRITSATDARVADDLANGVITDDDRRPRITVADTYVVEGDAGSTVMRFTVRLSNASERTVSVDYDTQNGSATAGVDFTGASNTLTFAPGQTSLTVDVNVFNNLGSQGHRDFDLVLSDATQAAISVDRATGTIIDDESTPVLLLDDVTVTERDSGLRIRNVTVRLSHAGASAASVNFATQDGTAKVNTDYAQTSGTVTFAAGETSKAFRIGVVGDTARERTEAFSVRFANPSGMQLIDTALGVTILDND